MQRASPPVFPAPGQTGLLRGWDSWLRSLLLNRFCSLLKLRELLFPLGGLGGFAPGVVELHQPFEGFRDPARDVEIRGQAGLALSEAFIALPQQPFGFVIFRLACETAAEEA